MTGNATMSQQMGGRASERMYNPIGTAIQNSRALQLYFRDVASQDALAPGEETVLSERIQQGDQDARDRLVLGNLWFVVRIAREYRSYGVPLADLISAGNIGLIKAAERFDGSMGVRFISYAVWWIRQSIQQTLAQDPRAVRLPTNRIALLRHISKATQVLRQEQEAEPSHDEIATVLGTSKKMVENTLVWAQDVQSFDIPLGDEYEGDLLDTMADPSAKAPDEAIMEASVRDQVREMLGRLSEREVEVLSLFWGLGDKDPWTLEKIGKKLNVTRERVRQIKDRALQKLRDSAQDDMGQYLDMA